SAYAVRSVRRLPRDTPEQRRDSLKKAEHVLERAADSEREGTGWTEHVLDTAWTVGSTAYIFGRSWRAGQSRHVHHRILKVSAIELVLSELVTEANILSTPRKAIRDHDRYRAAGCELKSSERAQAARPARTQAWNVSLGASHFALTFRF
ncbi:MAG: hypothetical protein JWN04_5193, partial [Myxococcaceae bacterium]|nr:hypothetical protein [Myxococcaceae bacterium]